ncbi:hypothetical protein BHM03_00039626 [Ensete ventricosum]|nr:hypothetical protein BHM03_00039626 [Ensete ventricosum]
MAKHGKTIGYLDKRQEMRRRSEIIPRRRTKKRCRRGGNGSISEHDKTPKGAASVRKLKETTLIGDQYGIDGSDHLGIIFGILSRVQKEFSFLAVLGERTTLQGQYFS